MIDCNFALVEINSLALLSENKVGEEKKKKMRLEEERREREFLCTDKDQESPIYTQPRGISLDKKLLLFKRCISSGIPYDKEFPALT